MKSKILLLSAVLVMLLAFCFTACSDDGSSTEPPEKENYTIQYTDNTGNHTIIVKTGDIYSLESIPQKTGYDFLGLFDMEDGGTQYVTATGNSLSTFNDNSNITLFPQFKAKEYTIVLDYQGAEVTGTRQIAVSFDSMIGGLPTNLTIPNKNFTGWYTEPNKAGRQIADKYGVNPMTGMVDENLVSLADDKGRICLYAGFKYQEYTLTLYIGENSVPEEILVEWGTHISSVQTETRVDGKAVLTWSKSKNDTTLANVFNGKVEGDMILYSAEYAPVIDFNTMGGNEVNSIVNRVGNTISLPTPKRENYTFMGWFDTTGTQFTSTAMPENSLTLNAKWQANIMLNENGGTDVQDITAPAGTAIELPIPERAGYIFAGWYHGDEKYTSTAMPENSITLTAKYYKARTYKKVWVAEGKIEYWSDTGSFLKIDLEQLVGANTETNLKFKVVFTGKHFGWLDDRYCDFKVGIYSNNQLSDTYLMSEYGYYPHNERKTYETYTYTTIVSVDAETEAVYVGISSPGDSTYSKSTYVEIEYPDMSTLY